MKKILISFFALALWFGGFAQNDTIKVKDYIIFLLKKYAPYHDFNYTWQDEADTINAIFIQALEGLNNFNKEQKRDLRTKALLLLYDNSRSWLEDSPDTDRVYTRRSLCHMIIALLSDQNKFETFTDYAMIEASRTRYYGKKQRMMLVHLLEYLLMLHFDNSAEYKCEEIRDLFVAEKDGRYDDDTPYFHNENFVKDMSILLQKLKCK